MMFVPHNASSNNFELKFGLFLHELMCLRLLVFHSSSLAQHTGQHGDCGAINFIFMVSYVFLGRGSVEFSCEIAKG